ncbi:RagB/SusD family nutrient uptake outer membrane protein [Spirosoma soli]|uniref:RagB/SusD family nutrient uptake outer membrane protein n=1 Tax=Spirosoma soli TaxID=1770529 RepID=A0ABW5M343_9BACT
MKKIRLATTITLTASYLLSGCSDQFLVRVPQGTYSPSATQNAQGVEALLTGAYGQLDGIPVPGSEWQGAVSNWVFGGITSDDAYKGTDAGDQPEQTALERYVWVTTNQHVRGKWGALYNGVARANLVLQGIPKATDLSATRRVQIRAEARFLRGFYLLEAKKMWNNIPYIDEKTYDPQDGNSTKVPNTDNAWPKIEADFQAAIDSLPEQFAGEPGRATKWSAIGMLAKAKMFQAFDPYTGAPNTAALQAAKVLLDQIINSNRFALADQYGYNYSAAPANRNNKESIFEVQYSVTAAADGGGGAGDDLAWPYNAGPGGCCGFYQPSQNLVNAFKTDANGLPMPTTFNDTDVTNDEGIKSNQPFTPYAGTLDPRLDHTVGRRGIPYKDWGIHAGYDWIRDQAYAGPYSPLKHIPEKAYSGTSAGNIKRSGNNYRYLRYDHILLWAAEVETEIGSLETARTYVNQIRTRAGNPAGFVKTSDGKPAANYVIGLYTAPWTDKAAARQAVRFEERLEFGMEGTRFFDLVRWGIAEPTLNAYVAKEQLKRTFLNGAQFKKNQNEYFPIPQQEIINSTSNGKATLVQNQGY